MAKPPNYTTGAGQELNSNCSTLIPNPFLSYQLYVLVCTTYLSLLLCRKICHRTEAPGVWVDCFDKSIFTVQVVLSKGTAGIQCDSSVVRRQCDTTLHTILKIQTCRTSRLNYKSRAR